MAAPDSHRGALPSHARFAADLRTALDVCVGVRLGEGRISVDGGERRWPGTASVAVSRCWPRPRPRGSRPWSPSPAQARPSAVDAARRVTAPTLHIAAHRDTVSPVAGHAEPIAAAAGGPVWLRTLRKADHTGFLDGKHWSDLLLTGGPSAKTRRLPARS